MKIKTIILIISVILGLNSACAQKAAEESVETKAIKQVLVDAYIKGIHIDRDIKLVQVSSGVYHVCPAQQSDHQSIFGCVAATT